MATRRLDVPFVARGSAGTVHVVVGPNTDPSAIGSPAWALDFPVCEATIRTDARGYRAMYGWVQLVGTRRPNSNASRRWETDPLEVFGDLDTPFGFHGVAPTLFDAPVRSDRSRPLDWCAESYLCLAPSDPMAREARPVAAFSWGFVVDGGGITVAEPRVLPRSAWTAHVDLLGTAYPTWTFIDAEPAPEPAAQ